MGSLSPIHWLIILGIALLFFGGGRISSVGKGLGEGIKNFKKGLKEGADDDESADDEDEEPPAKQLKAGAKKKAAKPKVEEDEEEAEEAPVAAKGVTPKEKEG
ncbi:MAG TPA: twin-arginine translocase TatA/TatE family subunit [Polyangiaceae bacterium]|jgi:sec-independent protein translocase protein TatA|nr:twin-arginine translocase TatA/TatE family subunit [Polyangiaceae bacterium]